MAKRYEVCNVDEIAPGERKIVDVKNISIGIFNIAGKYYALKNECPHRRVALCTGRVTGKLTAPEVGEFEWDEDKDGAIIHCPSHRWEFDITTGESIVNPHKTRAMTFETSVEADDCGECETTEEQQVEEYGTTLEGEEPPIDTYEVEETAGVLYVKA
jgi:nitrite reductase/ring-hydroxylating ferredoxin subunit